MTTLGDLLGAIKGTASTEDAEDVVALLLLGDPSKVQAEGRALLDRFATRAALSPSLAGGALEAAVQAYLDRHPLNTAVLASLKTVAERLSAQKGPRSGDVDAALSMLGKESSRAPLDAGARPAGTVPAGPMARFNVDAKKPKP